VPRQKVTAQVRLLLGGTRVVAHRIITVPHCQR
jgi:hypothetical protein